MRHWAQVSGSLLPGPWAPGPCTASTPGVEATPDIPRATANRRGLRCVPLQPRVCVSVCGLCYSLTQHGFIALSRAKDTGDRNGHSPCPPGTPRGSQGPFHSFPVAAAHSHPQLPGAHRHPQGLTNTNTQLPCRRTVWVHARTCTHEVRSVQSPMWCPDLLAAPTCPPPEPGSQGREGVTPWGPLAPSDVGHRQGVPPRCVCTLSALEGQSRPDPSLVLHAPGPSSTLSSRSHHT